MDPVETGVAETINALARTPLGYVASVGTNGMLLVSPDAADWSGSTVPVNRALRGLAASAEAIVAVGDQESRSSSSYATAVRRPKSASSHRPRSSGRVPRSASRLRHVGRRVPCTNGSGTAWRCLVRTPPHSRSPRRVPQTRAPTPCRSQRAGRDPQHGRRAHHRANRQSGTTGEPVHPHLLASADDEFRFGVVVGGTGTAGGKAVLMRAVGPSLASFGLGDALEDPRLEFFTGATAVGGNDNWGGSASIAAAMAGVGAFPLARADSRDAAISFPSLASGANSARISGTGPGAVLAELYDATPSSQFTASTPRLVNVSVLKHLGSGVTAGFVIGGGSPRRVLVRAIGPGLAIFGVGGVVADPRLTLFAGPNERGGNDNWGGGASLAAAFAQVGAFALATDSRDAALLATLEPGNYTVQVAGAGGATGVGLIEIYEVP